MEFFSLPFFSIFFWLLGFWLLGFLAISASWLLGFLASWLLGFLAFRFLVGLWWLFGFGFSHPLDFQFLFSRGRFDFCGGFWRLWLFASSAFLVPRQVFWLCILSLVFGFRFRHHQHHQFLLISIITSSNIMGASPPTHPLLFRLFQSNCTPI